ncbi:OCIA domain-containing protein 1, partial [Microcaecilia unicolor]|uniref:OCIA domain-containing protein 1 n=1 Tax=Microcaecilia unicolor TaxID=1415580 RepID=A0A6P7WXU5_9AMPH
PKRLQVFESIPSPVFFNLLVLEPGQNLRKCGCAELLNEGGAVPSWITLVLCKDLFWNSGLVNHSSLNPVSMAYVPTEEERRVFRECNEESFWYRSLPISAVSMLATQFLISRGTLTSSSRFGSIPKVAFAGACGYIAGKISYMKTCQEKFKRLENSPLGDVLRQGYGSLPSNYPGRRVEFADAGNVSSTAPLQRAEAPSASSYSDDHSFRDHDAPRHESAPFSASLSESSPTGITDHAAKEPTPLLDDTPKRKPVTYEELRSKNRESYEVTVTQKAETSVRPPQEQATRKDVKTNKYGDVWEE